MKIFYSLPTVLAAALITGSVFSAPSWAQQSSDSSSSQDRDTNAEVTATQDTSNDDSFDARDRRSREQRANDADNRNTLRNRDRDNLDNRSGRDDQAQRPSDRRDRQDRNRDGRSDRNRDNGDRYDRDDAIDRLGDRFENRADRMRERFDNVRDRFEERWDQDDDNGNRGRAQGDVELGASLRANAEGRLIVDRLSRQGLLSDAEIRQGDTIISIDGRDVSSEAELRRMLRQADSGERIPLVVMRDNQRRTVYLQGRSQFGQDLGINLNVDPRGRLLVSNVDNRGLFANSGLRRGDVIIELLGRPVRSQQEFIGIVRRYDEPRLPVVVLRDGQRQTIYISTESTYGWDDQGYDPDHYRPFPGDDRGWLGVYLDMRYSNHAVVEGVQIGSAADRAGLRDGDWITRLNGIRIQGPGHLSHVVRRMEPGENVDMEISRRVTRDVSAQLGERPPSGRRFRYDQDRYDQDLSSRRSDEAFQADSRREGRSYRGTSLNGNR